MDSRRFIRFGLQLIISTVAFFLSQCVTIDQEVRHDGKRIEADFPEMSVGDTWYTEGYSRKHGSDKFRSKVIKVKRDGSFIIEKKPEKDKDDSYYLYYNNQYRLVKKINIYTGEEVNIPNPPKIFLDFPLFVGKKWKDDYYGKSVDGSNYHYTNYYKVIDYEDKSTPAGSFKAFHIKRLNKLVQAQSDTDQYIEHYWYSPELKRIITSKPNWRAGSELISYHLAQEDKKPPEIHIVSPDMIDDIADVEHDKPIITGEVTDDIGVKWFTVNGKNVVLSHQGGFSVEASLTQQKNTFLLKACDLNNNLITKTVFLNLMEKQNGRPDVEIPQQNETAQENKIPEQNVVHSQRWAVVIGISKYKDSRIPSLHYASEDAKAFYHWLISDQGGRYSPSNVNMLVDEDASKRNIQTALFQWLRQAIEEDVITLYFAGHGSPDSPDTPDNLYLLPHDCEYDNVAVSGIPMWDIETAVQRFVKAKKIIVVADACYSGGIGKSFDIARRSARGIGVNPINFGFQSLSTINDGICVITAADEKQFSQEGPQWGGGHGVFTYFLLEGLRGDADNNKDNRVTIGEIIPYLSENVRRATMNAQTPTVAGRYDPELTIGK